MLVLCLGETSPKGSIAQLVAAVPSSAELLKGKPSMNSRALLLGPWLSAAPQHSLPSLSKLMLFWLPMVLLKETAPDSLIQAKQE